LPRKKETSAIERPGRHQASLSNDEKKTNLRDDRGGNTDPQQVRNLVNEQGGGGGGVINRPSLDRDEKKTTRR